MYPRHGHMHPRYGHMHPRYVPTICTHWTLTRHQTALHDINRSISWTKNARVFDVVDNIFDVVGADNMSWVDVVGTIDDTVGNKK